MAARSQARALEMFERLLGYKPDNLYSVPYFPEVDAFGNKIVTPKVIQ